MGLIDLYVRDKCNGKIYRIGDNPHDQLTVDQAGNIHYSNLQNGDGCRTGRTGGGYEFVPNEDDMGYNIDPREDGYDTKLTRGRTVMTLDKMVEELQASGKYVCGVNGLPCSFCELYCEHRKERDNDET